MVRRFAPAFTKMLPLLSALSLVVPATEAAAQAPTVQAQPLNFAGEQEKVNAWTVGLAAGPVSYTHLTLPTILRV